MAYDTRTFSEKKEIGNLGEQKVKAVSELWGYEVEDVSDNPEYFDKGYDLIARKDGKEVHLEVKTDNKTWTTGNLCVEEVSNYETNKPGWLYTGADDVVIVFYDPYNEMLRYTKMKHLREFVATHYCRHMNHKEWEGSYLKTAGLCLVSWEKLKVEHGKEINLREVFEDEMD